MNFAAMNGVVLHHADTGEADLPAIAFANSLGTDFRIWDDMVAGLRGRFRCIRYDKRGHGLSDAPDAPYAMDDHVGDLVALLDHLAVPSAIICGLSVGGMIAQGIAASHPDKVRAVILCDTGHVIGDAEMWNGRIDAVERDGLSALTDGVMQRWFTATFRAPASAAFVGYRNMFERTPVAGYAGTSAAIRDANFTKSTAELRIPALCIVGDEDKSTTPALVRELAGLIDGASYAIINDAGHLPCIEQPQAQLDLMDRFFRENDLG
ncbi:MAG: 3-oxoadipate enol-lactonase [Minwuia sp.]|nr:3-oxoadipate enol-lactonase [Minwuia sp.]